jgi:hypothetical protein
LARHIDVFPERMPDIFSDLNVKERERTRVRIVAAPMRPSFARNCPSEVRGRREGRVQAAPMARQQTKKLAAVTTGLAGHPAFPAQWFYGLYVISPGTGLSCPRRRADVISAT